jgi:hypothetical protein
MNDAQIEEAASEQGVPEPQEEQVVIDTAPELEPEIEIVEDNEPEAVEEEPAPKAEFDPKTDRVDFDTPEQQAKFNDVYKQMKQSDARNQMLTELLEEQQRQLDEIKGRFDRTDEAAAEQLLMERLEVAKEEGDDEAYNKALKDLVAFEAEKAAAEKKEAKAEFEYTDAMATQDAHIIMGAAQETDNNGNLLRPWIYPNHPLHNEAVKMAEIVSERYNQNDPDIVNKVIRDMDFEMRNIQMASSNEPPRPQARTRAPDPMGSTNLTNTTAKGKIKMSRAELEIAKKLGVDPKKYHAHKE